MKRRNKFTSEVSIVLCGAAGLGIQTVEDLLIKVLKKSKYHIFATKEYMSRVRGGLNSTEIRVSSNSVKAYLDRIDLFFVFSPGAINRHRKRLTENSTIIGQKENIAIDEEELCCNFINAPLIEEAEKIGNKIYTNSIAAGIIAGLLDVDIQLLDEYFQERFAAKGDKIIENNSEAARVGFRIAANLEKEGTLEIEIPTDKEQEDQIVLSGTEAVAIGAIAGGCNYIAAYPMSPSTGVFTYLAQHQKEFDIVVEQAEDEIAAINSAVGAWYVGGRGIANTSGGGFALMEEGVSLIGVTETPMVIHIAQRPGPSTGLPTRTAQEDLNLALFSGHGEFPRIIFAPGTIQDCFYLTQKAFNLADKYQIPVFVLTDQYLNNSYYNIDPISAKGLKIESHIVETTKDYKRYAFTENGISPRGIPGGKGLIAVDSHEHDEEGHITEDLEYMRKKMNEKRFKKMELIRKEIEEPIFIGEKKYELLVIGWGSTYHIIHEAIEKINNKKIGYLHFKQVYPIQPVIEKLLKQAKEIVVIENNIGAQFCHLLKSQFCVTIKHTILKHIGLPFSVEEIQQGLEKILEEMK